MIVIAFVCFALLVIAWMAAPSTSPVASPELEPSPAIQVGEATA